VPCCSPGQLRIAGGSCVEVGDMAACARSGRGDAVAGLHANCMPAGGR